MTWLKSLLFKLFAPSNHSIKLGLNVALMKGLVNLFLFFSEKRLGGDWFYLGQNIKVEFASHLLCD